MPPISKAEFARRRHVTPARVSQWISEGKITGAAIVGEGRNAQIDEEVALGQLNRTLDVDQRHANGVRTDLSMPVALATAPIAAVADPIAAPAVPSAPAAPVIDRNSQLLDERLETLRRQNRIAQVDEERANGRLIDAEDAQTATARELRLAFLRMEGALPTFATAIAAEFKIPQRDVLHLLRAKWRDARHAGAIDARARAEHLPERVGYEIEDAAGDDQVAAP